MMTNSKNYAIIPSEIRKAASEKTAYFKEKEIIVMLFAKRYQEHSISIYESCEEYYSQVSFAMEFGNGARSGIPLR